MVEDVGAGPEGALVKGSGPGASGGGRSNGVFNGLDFCSEFL